MSSSHPTLHGGKFSFEIWLKKNDLLEYKDLFVSHSMTTIDQLSTSSTNYSELLSDAKIVSNPLLISKIALTVNNLQTAYQTVKDDVISKMENKLNELHKYEKNDNDFLLFNYKLYEIEKTKDEKQLNEIRLKIQNLFSFLFKILKQKEQTILKKFKTIQNEILIKYNKIIEKMKKNDDEILLQKDYLKTHIKYYKHNIQNIDNKNKNHNINSIFAIRDIIHKIGRNIRKNDAKTRKLVHEKQQLLNDINFHIDDDIKQYITDNTAHLINFEVQNKNSPKSPIKKRRKSNKMSPKKYSRNRSNSNTSHTSLIDASSLDLINMSPHKIRAMDWIYNLEDDNCNCINIELKKELSQRELSNMTILYQYHANEEDEKDNIAIKPTINDSINGEQEVDIDYYGLEAPNTPVPIAYNMFNHKKENKNQSDMTMEEMESYTDDNSSKISQWVKCKNISFKQQDGKRTNKLFVKIVMPNKHRNIDCVWVKLVDENHESGGNCKQVMSEKVYEMSPSTCVSASTRLLVEEGQVVKLQSSVEYNFDEIIIEKNGILTVNSSAKGYLLLKIRNKLEIHSHGKLNVSGLGHKGGKRYACGEGKGGGGGCAKGYSSCGGGGGYGTFGSNGRGWSDNMYRENIDGIGGNIYGDSALSTIHFGSGGGGGYGSRGGNGGGIICISCKNKIILHENSGIYANGNKGKYYYDGCGSGGSIFIKCKYLYNENNCICFIQAIGGKHDIEEHQSGHGGNGGFGRVRIYSQNIKTLQQLKEQCFVVTPVPYIG